jgi:hypothetical protein
MAGAPVGDPPGMINRSKSAGSISSIVVSLRENSRFAMDGALRGRGDRHFDAIFQQPEEGEDSSLKRGKNSSIPSNSFAVRMTAFLPSSGRRSAVMIPPLEFMAPCM